MEYLQRPTQKNIDRWSKLSSSSDGDEAIFDEYHRDVIASFDFQQDLFVE